MLIEHGRLIEILGTGGVSKMDEFLEKFQTAFDPPLPNFRKIILPFFPKALSKALYKGPKSAI